MEFLTLQDVPRHTHTALSVNSRAPSRREGRELMSIRDIVSSPHSFGYSHTLFSSFYRAPDALSRCPLLYHCVKPSKGETAGKGRGERGVYHLQEVVAPRSIRPRSLPSCASSDFRDWIGSPRRNRCFPWVPLPATRKGDQIPAFEVIVTCPTLLNPVITPGALQEYTSLPTSYCTWQRQRRMG